MASVSALRQQKITAMQHQIGGGADPFQVARTPSILRPACFLFPKVFPTTKKNGTFTDEIGLPEPYRYGDSNPGFRTENPAS
jgi:hypothetical protein